MTMGSAAVARASQARLAIIGGRLEDDNRRVYREMRRLSGGRILVFATASSEPEEVGEETLAAFRTHGFEAELASLHGADPARAFDPALVAAIGAAGGVYFTGGDQSKIVSALVRNGEETPVLKAIRDRLAAGGLLAGSSAGAAMMSEIMILGGTSLEAMVHGVVEDADAAGMLLGRGLGFFRHGLVDQHFIKRGRIGRMIVAMAHAGVRRGFGVDENTALFIDGERAHVCGEYGVVYADMARADVDAAGRAYRDVRLSYLDDGDAISLKNFTALPGEQKRRVKPREVAYRAPARSSRNAFGAYALYDLMARLVLGDQKAYASDRLDALDARAGVNASIVLKRVHGRTRCLIATPQEGLRMTGVDFRASLEARALTADMIAERQRRAARSFGMDLNERSRIVLLGSSPLYCDPPTQKQFIAAMGGGPVGVFAAASSEARRTAEEHVAFFRDHGVEAVDLGVTIDTVEYVSRDPEALDRIASMKTIFMCGGNQIRLVETLLHRGEESAVMAAVARAYADGASLVGSSGAVSAFSSIMIAGGGTYEALRYGVASDLGHQGLVVQEGLGLLAAGLADQNIITARRLGRLIVACVEENERFGVGVCEESAVVAAKSGVELEATGRHGFALVEIIPHHRDARDDRFIAKGVRVRMFGPGDRVNIHSGHVERACDETAAAVLFDRLIEDLMREGVDLDLMERTGRDPGVRHSIRLRARKEAPLAAVLDIECAREEHD